MFPRRVGPLDRDGGRLDILQLESHVRIELVDCNGEKSQKFNTKAKICIRILEEIFAGIQFIYDRVSMTQVNDDAFTFAYPDKLSKCIMSIVQSLENCFVIFRLELN